MPSDSESSSSLSSVGEYHLPRYPSFHTRQGKGCGCEPGQSWISGMGSWPSPFKSLMGSSSIDSIHIFSYQQNPLLMEEDRNLVLTLEGRWVLGEAHILLFFLPTQGIRFLSEPVATSIQSHPSMRLAPFGTILCKQGQPTGVVVLGTGVASPCWNGYISRSP